MRRQRFVIKCSPSFGSGSGCIVQGDSECWQRHDGHVFLNLVPFMWASVFIAYLQLRN